MTQKMLRHSKPSSPQSLPVRQAFGNLKPLRPHEKSGSRKPYPWWRRTKQWSTSTNWTCVSPSGPGRLHPQELRELTATTARPLSIIFERSQ